MHRFCRLPSRLNSLPGSRGDRSADPSAVVRAILLATLLVALLVAVKRPRDATALVGSAFLATIGVFSVTLPYRFASVWRALPLIASVPLWIPFMSSVAIAAWGVSFFSIFPRVRFRGRPDVVRGLDSDGSRPHRPECLRLLHDRARQAARSNAATVG